MPAGTWIAERSGGTGGGGTGAAGLVIGFVINNGTLGNNVGPMLPAPRAGTLTRCMTVVKTSTAVALAYRVKKNGSTIVNVFVGASQSSGTKVEFTLSSTVALDDVFTIDITAGGPLWKFTAQLE